MAKYRVQVHTHNNTKDITAPKGGIFFDSYQEAKYAAKCAADELANQQEKRGGHTWEVKFRREKPPVTLYVSIEKQGGDYKLSGYYDIF